MAGGVRVRVRLTPHGGADRIDGPGFDDAGAAHLKCRVSAAPEDGKANAALEALLAKALGVAKSAVRLEKGATGRIKTLVIMGVDEGQVREKLLTQGKR
jgi:uncharacterized protein YggU (UPF0235/DUF167 family)